MCFPLSSYGMCLLELATSEWPYEKECASNMMDAVDKAQKVR